MGTSSARRAPVSRPWRLAKTLTSRFASGKEATPPLAREVVARYLTALEGRSTGTVAASGPLLPEVARTAMNLGNFYQAWHQEGMETAAAYVGVPVGPRASDEFIPLLLDRLAGPGSTLGEAAARAALLDHFETIWDGGAPSNPKMSAAGSPDRGGQAGVAHFLGLALYRKLTSDLGESLEYHAPSVQAGCRRQEELKAHILAAAEGLQLDGPSTGAVSEDQAAAWLARLILHLGGDHDR